MRLRTLFIIVSSLASVIAAQNPHINPDRGGKLGNGYSIGEFETINTTNGNLMFNFPLGSLPAGRGQAAGAIHLTYNSKLYNLRTEKLPDHRYTNEYYDRMVIEADLNKGGWQITGGYRLETESRFDNEPSCTVLPSDLNDQILYSNKLKVIFPDGSAHEMIPAGHKDKLGDRFFNVSPDGIVRSCSSSPTYTARPVYYSRDGSFLRLETNETGWTLYFPDGSKVTDGSQIVDRNGNYVTNTTASVADEFGRTAVVSTDTNGDTLVTSDGVGGSDIVWRIKWKHIAVGKTYKACQPHQCPADQFPLPDYVDTLQVTFKVVDRIVQPSQLGGGEYVFGYNAPDYSSGPIDPSDGWGEVTSIQLPSGAEVHYEYTMDGLDGPDVDTPDILRSYPSIKTLKYDLEYDGSVIEDGAVETWLYQVGTDSSVVTAPDGSVTTTYFGSTDPGSVGFLPWNSGLTLKIVHNNGTMVENIWAKNSPTACDSTNTCASGTYGDHADNPYVKTEFTSIKSGSSYTLTAIKDYTYDKNGNVTEVKEYDFVPYSLVDRDTNGRPTGVPSGTSSYLKRITKTEYYNDAPTASSTTYTDADSYHLTSSKRLLRLPKSVTVQDASETTKSRTEFTYDHTDYGSSNTKAGNATVTRHWDSTKGSVTNPLTDGNSVKTQATYNGYGMLLVTTDANGVETTTTYGCLDGSAPTCPSGAPADLYPTKVETVSNYSLLKRTATSKYDFHTGVVTESKDVDNDVIVKTVYDDLGRPAIVKNAFGMALESWTQTEYHDEDRYVVVRSDLETKEDAKKVAIQHFDQLGRVRLSRTLEDASTQEAADPCITITSTTCDGVKVQTRYLSTYSSPNGYTYQLTSNPYRASVSTSETDPTMGWTRSKAHQLGAHAEVETFSGASLPAPWGSNTTSTGMVQTDIDANATTITDQAGKLRRSVTNALGQLIRVDEPNSSNQLDVSGVPVQSTNYHYNTLGKMIHVAQGDQDRYFMYDSLGRMLRVRQPEQTVNTALNTSGNPDNNSWTAGFTYDNNGNVLTATDAKNVTITNQYDALNRVTQRSYNDSPQTPTVTFTYDEYTGAKGKLTKVSSSVSESKYTQFDAAGRLKQFQQITDGHTYTSSYDYNLSGALVKETYPSGRVVENDFDNNGHLSRIFGKATTTATERTYANSFTYTPDGKIEKLRLGNGLWEAAKLNARSQVTEFTLGYGPASGDLWKLNIEYGELQTNGTVDATKNSGSIGKQTVTFNGLANPFVQTFKYDPLYRLTEAKETSNGTQTWKQVFDYDRYGNRTTYEKYTGSTLETLSPEVFPDIDPDTNRFESTEGFTFDANGNVVEDAQGRQFTFNGDNKQTKALDDQSNVIGEYFFDGEGKRVKKVVGSETTVFVYSSGKLIAEYSTETPPHNPTTSYTITDQLGSPRIIVNALGEVVSRRDFMPFGEEIVADGTYRTTSRKYGQSDRVRQRFTGYQKDSETELDFAEARMFQNLHGRFTAVDPLLASGKSADPQTFNRYVYVMNNPLILTDPSGLQAGTEASQTIYPCAGGRSACEYTVNEAQRKLTVNNRSLATVTVTAEPDLIAPSLSCPGGDSTCGSGNIVFRSPLTQGASVGEVQTVLDVIGATETPVASQVADFISGGISFSQGDTTGGILSVGAAFPVIGNAFAGLKWGRRAEDVLKEARELGKAGERLAGISDAPKTAIKVDGRTLFPDEITREALTEVKNVGKLSYTRQLRDYNTHAKANQLDFVLWTRPDTKISGPLQRAIDNNEIIRKCFDGGANSDFGRENQRT